MILIISDRNPREESNSGFKDIFTLHSRATEYKKEGKKKFCSQLKKSQDEFNKKSLSNLKNDWLFESIVTELDSHDNQIVFFL